MPRQRREIPWLETRDNGVYYVCWYDAGTRRTRRKSLGTTDAVLAQARYAAFLAESGDIVSGSQAEGLSVPTALRQYLSEHVDENCAAGERQHYAVDRLLGFFGDDIAIHEIDIPLSRRYLKWRRGEGATVRGMNGHASVHVPTAATLRRELNVLVAAGHHAVRWRRLRPDQLPVVELPRVPKRRLLVLTVDQVKTLIAGSEGRLRAFVKLAYFTAARREAIRDLTVPQVDFGRRLIHLHPDGAVGTIKRKPIVPIFPEIEPELRMLIETSEADRLFPEPFDAYRRVVNLGKRHGLKIHPHLFRHSRATHLLQAGQGLEKVAALLGDSVATVERNYWHASVEFVSSAVTPFDSDLA